MSVASNGPQRLRPAPKPVKRAPAAGRGPIVFFGPNSAIDEVFRTDGRCPLAGTRVRRAQAFAGGKAANAAHATALEGAVAILIGFAGGANGKRFTRLLRERGVRGRLVGVQAETRRTFCFLDPDGCEPHLVVENGLPVTRVEVAALERALGSALHAKPAPRALVIGGSLPPGCKATLVRRVLRRARRAGIPTIVDTHGAPLAAAASGRADVLVPNEREFAVLVGRDPERSVGTARLLLEARALLRARAGAPGALVLKRGAAGVLYVSADRAFVVAGPPRRGNPTGSGDVVTAHVALALARGQDPIGALPRAVAAAAANLDQDEPAHYDRRTVARLVRQVEVRPLRARR